MKRLLQIIILAVVVVTVVACLPINFRGLLSGKQPVDAAPMSLAEMPVTSALIVDADTGQIVAEKQPDQQVPIASQSKMLVAYGVLKRIQSGQAHWEDQVTIPSCADLHLQDVDMFNHISIKAGDTISLHDLYTTMLALSANDAAFALGDYLTPPGQTVQQTLQQLADELKLDGSQWYNAAGQSNGDAFENKVAGVSDDAQNTASARQLAVLEWQLLANESHMLEIDQQATVSFHNNAGRLVHRPINHWYDVTNKMPDFSNPKGLTIEGGKTGSTPSGGGSFTGVVRDKTGHRFITVINGAGRYTDQGTRYQATIHAVEKVLDHQKAHVLKEDTPLTGQEVVDVPGTNKYHIPVRVGADRHFWTSSDTDLPLAFTTWVPHVQRVQAGDVLTTATPAGGEQFLTTDLAEKQALPLVATTDSQPANWFVGECRKRWH